jgi:hypothetical protein
MAIQPKLKPQSPTQGDKLLPVESVSWDDTQSFCLKLKEITQAPFWHSHGSPMGIRMPGWRNNSFSLWQSVEWKAGQL